MLAKLPGRDANRALVSFFSPTLSPICGAILEGEAVRGKGFLRL